MATKKAATPDTEKAKPELLPAEVSGTIHWLKRADYAKHIASALTIQLKTDFKRDHITQVLDALDGGAIELQGENPEEFTKMFEAVKGDYESAVKKVEEDAAEAAKKQAEEEEKQKKEVERQEALFLSIKDKAPADFASITDGFDTGSMDRFVPKGDVTSEQLLGALNASFSMGGFTNWMQGDLVAELEKRGELNVVSKLSETRGEPYSTLYNKAKTAKAFPPEKRVKGISYTICAEVALAKFTAEQEKAKLALVDEVLAGKVNTQEARAKVKEIQGKTQAPTVLPEDNEKKAFLVVDPNADLKDLVNIAIGLPKDLFSKGAIVIDPSTKLMFAGYTKKPENRWVAVPEYKKAEPVAAATNGAAPAKKKGGKK